MTDRAEMTMNALYVRFICAVVLLATALLATSAKAAALPVEVGIAGTASGGSSGTVDRVRRVDAAG